MNNTMKVAVVLAGNSAECSEYYKRNPSGPKIMYFNGLGILAGIHADRLVFTGSFFSHPNAHNILQMAKMHLNPDDDVEIVVDGHPDWYVKWDTQGDPIMHDEFGSLRCNRCKRVCSETHKGGICGTCKGAEKAMAFIDGKAKGPQLVRKEGDIWKMDKSNSPMWTEQWGYQGSSKIPYVISHNPTRSNGATTNDGWACSCPGFCRNTPRTPCKHILNVRLKEGYVDLHTKGAAKLANVDAAKLKAFEAWEREQAAAKPKKSIDKANLNLFGATGRKFR